MWKAVPTWETDLDAARHYAFQVMEYSWAFIPYLLQKLGTYLTVERAESLRGHGVLSRDLRAFSHDGRGIYQVSSPMMATNTPKLHPE